MNIDEVNRCIAQLEQDETTFSNCQKLASLLIVREFCNPDLKSGKSRKFDQVELELCDILPHYEKYCSIKAEYQQHNIGKEPVIESLEFVCREIAEFLKVLYSHTDMPEERDVLKNLVNNITLF